MKTSKKVKADQQQTQKLFSSLLRNLAEEIDSGKVTPLEVTFRGETSGAPCTLSLKDTTGQG